MDTIPWVEKYRPKYLNEIIQTNNLIDLFQNIINTGKMPHLLFYGPPGTGKTSSILALGRELYGKYFSSRIIEFNASDDRGINAVREKITSEAKKFVAEIIEDDKVIIPPYKIIILDEADSMTDEAQDALRVIVEQYSSVTRFCFICNYINKITDSIKSRCVVLHFKKLDNTCMIKKLKTIAEIENMSLDNNIYNTIISVSGGDMRKAIMLLQNLKYSYEFRKFINKSLNDMTVKELNILQIVVKAKENTTDMMFPKNSITNNKISDDDVYEVSGSISVEHAKIIISKVILCKSIIDVAQLSKEITATGRSNDEIIMQLISATMVSDLFTDIQKANIIQYSGNVLYKIKNCANEYIQLVDLLSYIYGIYNKIKMDSQIY